VKPEVGGSSSRGVIYGKGKYWKFLVGEESKGFTLKYVLPEK